MNARALAILAGVVAFFVYGSCQRAAGREDEQRKQIAARVDTLTVEVRRTDTVYRQTVKTLAKVLTVYDSVRVSDTVSVVRDSVRVVYVERSAADTAVAMCRRLVLTCEARVAATDSLVRALRSQVQFERDQRPGFISTWGWRLGFLALGYAAGR